MHAQITNPSSSSSRRTGFRRSLLAVATTSAFLVAMPALLRAQQTLYVSSGSQTIDQVSPAGAVSAFVTLTANSNPAGLAFDASGNLYVAATSTNQISRISPAGVVSTFATLPTPVYSNPVGLVFGSDGNLYAASTTNSRVSRISPAGTVSAFASVNPGYSLHGLAFDAQGNLYAADGSNQIDRISPAGVVSRFASVPAPSDASLSDVEGLAFDASGNLYAADAGTNQIIRIDSAGTASLFANLPIYSGPKGLVFDRSGNLFVADGGSNQISEISPDGLTISTFATNVPSPAYLTFGAVPEPSTWAFILLGGIVAVALRNKRRLRRFC